MDVKKLTKSQKKNKARRDRAKKMTHGEDYEQVKLRNEKMQQDLLDAERKNEKLQTQYFQLFMVHKLSTEKEGKVQGEYKGDNHDRSKQGDRNRDSYRDRNRDVSRNRDGDRDRNNDRYRHRDTYGDKHDNSERNRARDRNTHSKNKRNRDERRDSGGDRGERRAEEGKEQKRVEVAAVAPWRQGVAKRLRQAEERSSVGTQEGTLDASGEERKISISTGECKEGENTDSVCNFMEKDLLDVKVDGGIRVSGKGGAPQGN